MKELCKSCGHKKECHGKSSCWGSNGCHCLGYVSQNPAPVESTADHLFRGAKEVIKATQYKHDRVAPPPPDIEAYIKDFREAESFDIEAYIKLGMEELENNVMKVVQAADKGNDELYGHLAADLIKNHESFLRHALTEYGDAREAKNAKFNGKKVGELVAKSYSEGVERGKIMAHEGDIYLKAEAYEKGFQAGHAKERWLKDEVEKEARNAALEDVYSCLEEARKWHNNHGTTGGAIATIIHNLQIEIQSLK